MIIFSFSLRVDLNRPIPDEIDWKWSAIVNAMSEIRSPNAMSAERRAGNRTTAVYRPVLIEIDQFTGFCLLRNISPGGLMGVVYADFSAEQPVTVQFHADHVVKGMVAWAREQRIGVRFDQEIDVAQVLRRLGGNPGDGRVNRAPRLPIECDGELVVNQQPLRFTVQDISQKGIKAAVGAVHPGEELVVRLAGLEPRKAIVRWIRNGTAGLNFIRPLGFEELAEWVIERQSRGG